MQNKLYFLIHMVVSLSFIMHVSADEFPKGVVASGSVTFFVKTDGTFWGTGGNSLGQLGNGQTVDSSTFTQMTGVSDIRGVAATGATTMVVKNDGTVWGVGFNSGMLGDGTQTRRENFVQALEKTTDAPITDVQAVSLGSGFAMALKTDGTLWTTGFNSKGKLGTNNDENSVELKFVQPVDSSLALMTDVKVIAGALAGEFGMAVKTDGTLWAAGFNNYRQLGIGTEDYYINTYTQAVDESGPITNVQDVSAGSDWAIVLKTDGTVWGAGFNSNGQLADETSETRSRFVQAKDASGGYITDVKSISAGRKQSMVLKTDGTVWVTGHCGYGSCGLGSDEHKYSYFQITSLSSDVVLISAGDWHMVAVKADGTLWSTGRNWNGQQGNGEAGNDINVADFTQVAEGVDTTFGIPPKDKLDTPFVFRNDPDQRATCRQITSKSACNDENACSWNVFMGMCNEHGHQPVFETCDACGILPTTTTTTTPIPDFSTKEELKAAITECLGLSDVGDCPTHPNGPIGSWVSDVTEMNELFRDATSFNGDIANWDVSSVTDMEQMFRDATSFNGDIANWQVSSVTDMSAMFKGAASFNGDIANWDVSSVTNMDTMFIYATSFDGDISNWDVSSVTDMNGMFYQATSFSRTLCGAWAAVSADKSNMFYDSPGSIC